MAAVEVLVDWEDVRAVHDGRVALQTIHNIVERSGGAPSLIETRIHGLDELEARMRATLQEQVAA